MVSTFDRPPRPIRQFTRVAILFSGGPAPAANAVISTAAVSFLRNGVEVVGCLNGYSRLMGYSPERPLVEGVDFLRIDHATLKRTRNRQGIMLGTARTNPGKRVRKPADLDDPEKAAPLHQIYVALRSIRADALISIGGDDTLKTANMLRLYQQRLPAGKPRIPVVHVPKTIDNDYNGIDFTFGYFTAVDTLAKEIQNLLYDAEATNGYFIAETMGRSAGWLAYGAAIAGEASLVIGMEDIYGELETTEVVKDGETGEQRQRRIMVMDKVVDRIVDLMVAREREGKNFGVVVLAEGLAELLPRSFLEGVGRDEFGHISIGRLNTAAMFEKLVTEAYERRTDKKRKVRGLQLGYEARCARPHAFDVVLGAQLGVGAYRALAEKGLDGVMISTVGQLKLNYVPFDELVDPETLTTVVRMIERGSDFQQLARFLETYQ
ncbi:MAG: 6-phosphofructokinase [Planctomycetes bacterium]|nr:6-phosphofructokinase [Planctomycetota bacterium]